MLLIANCTFSLYCLSYIIPLTIKSSLSLKSFKCNLKTLLEIILACLTVERMLDIVLATLNACRIMYRSKQFCAWHATSETEFHPSQTGADRGVVLPLPGCIRFVQTVAC